MLLLRQHHKWEIPLQGIASFLWPIAMLSPSRIRRLAPVCVARGDFRALIFCTSHDKRIMSRVFVFSHGDYGFVLECHSPRNLFSLSNMSAFHITLHGNDLSQPSRAVRFFLRLNKIPHKFNLVRVERGETRRQDFLKINPIGKIPSMTIERPNQEPFQLGESVAIIKLLQELFGKEGLEYSFEPEPKDAFTRAKIESYLHAHHETTRRAFAGYFQAHHLFPLIGRPVSEKELEAAEKRVTKNLEWFESEWLSDKGPFVNGLKKPTIADLLAYEEMAQMKCLPGFPHFEKHPRVVHWMQEMEKLPEWAEVHSWLLRLRAKKEETSKL